MKHAKNKMEQELESVKKQLMFEQSKNKTSNSTTDQEPRRRRLRRATTRECQLEEPEEAQEEEEQEEEPEEDEDDEEQEEPEEEADVNNGDDDDDADTEMYDCQSDEEQDEEHEEDNDDDDECDDECDDEEEPQPKARGKGPNKPTKPGRGGFIARSKPGKMTEAAKRQRLRRLCETKPSGKCHVPPEVHETWKNGTDAERDQLLALLEKSQWKKVGKQFVLLAHGIIKNTLTLHTSQ